MVGDVLPELLLLLPQAEFRLLVVPLHGCNASRHLHRAGGCPPVITVTGTGDTPVMTTQLRLIDGGDRRPWRLDPRTRAIGRRGVAMVRLELERARPSVVERPLEQRRAG